MQLVTILCSYKSSAHGFLQPKRATLRLQRCMADQVTLSIASL